MTTHDPHHETGCPKWGHLPLTADIVAVLPWPFAIMGIYRLLGRHTPILAAVGAVIAMVGWTMLPSPATLGALFSLFLEGRKIGTLLPGLALARSRIP